MTRASRYRARSVSVNATPAATAASTWIVRERRVRDASGSTSPNQLTAMDRPTPTPKTRPSSWTSALAVLATPDCRCSVESSRMPIVSVMPGRKRHERREGDDVRRDVGAQRVRGSPRRSSPRRAATGATIGAVRAARWAGIAIAPTTRPDDRPPAIASRQPPPRTGVSAAPASAYPRELERPRTARAGSPGAPRGRRAPRPSRRPSRRSWTSSSRRAIASRSTTDGRTRSV